LPAGPVEKAGDGAGAAVAGTAALLLGIGQVSLVNAALAAGAPKAARTGREAFAAGLSRSLSDRGALVLDKTALRRLDRVDVVVLDAEVLLTGRQAIEEVLPVGPDPDHGEVVERAHDLVDLRRPHRRRTAGDWSVEPVAAEGLDPTERALADTLAVTSHLVLVLRHHQRVRALVGVTPALDPYAEAVVQAARSAGRVLLAGPEELATRVGADGALDDQANLADAVRGLQAAGDVVALVSRHTTALLAADVAVCALTGVCHPVWTADIITASPAQTCLLLHAVGPAAAVSRRSAQLVVAGSTAGGLLAMLGSRSGAATRATLAVHTAALLALGSGAWAASAVARGPEPVAADSTPWHAMSHDAVLNLLTTSRAGLAESEAQRRRHDRGRPGEPHEIGLVRATTEELANPLTPALAAGAGVSAATGSLLDPLLIMGVLGMNGLIGGVQRLGAQRALHGLRRISTSRVRVRRSGKEIDSGADHLVEGDVIRLQAGDAVPADCRVLIGHELEIDESSFTGESVPVPKSPRASSARALADRRSMLYEGTVVATGRGEAVVVATGERTEVGRALRANGEEAPPTGVEIRLRELTKRTLPFAAGAGVALVLIDLLRHRPWTTALGRAASLAVAAVPEGLPFVATVAELSAARRLSTRGALVRNPSTIEALGRVDVLCFDKTGTLTEGRISLRQVFDGSTTAGVDGELSGTHQAVVASAVRASPFQLDLDHVTHQTDRAVLRGADRLGVGAGHGHSAVEHLGELSFESFRGYHATRWRADATIAISVKGAPEVVLPLCARRRRGDDVTPLDDSAREAIANEIHRLAKQGQRVLAVAERVLDPGGPGEPGLADEDIAELDFLGLVALVDPVRPTAAAAVATLRAAGVRIVMITGDHPSTAESIAVELDALDGRQVVGGTDLDDLTDDQLAELLPDIAVFARATPAHKARVVQLLQRTGAAVAVTGDGTNDAPAIRLADIGIALGSRATTAAREAADVVITDDRIETITDAIVEGRGMWSSVRDALSILLGGNLGEIAYTVGTALFSGGTALNARQLLLINLLTDVLPAMAVAVRPPPNVSPDQLLAEGPEASLSTSLVRDIQVRAAITATGAALGWFAARPVSTPRQASTTGMVALVGSQLAQTLAVRGRTPLVVLAVVGSLAVLAVAVQTPGVSHVVGCRPLLPHQWAIALTAAGGAGIAQATAQRIGTNQSRADEDADG
jgi:cation-transporting ATPase I